MFDDALESVFVARNLLDRAKYALSIASIVLPIPFSSFKVGNTTVTFVILSLQ